MLRFYLRLTLIPIALFTAVLILIHTQPYDNHELHQLLLPEGCQAPCFMGIRPGVTTVDEAIKILDATGWVQQYSHEETIIRIRWNDKSPEWLSKLGYRYNFIRIEEGVVSQFGVETNMLLGDMRLNLGQPLFQHISLEAFEGGNTLLFYAGIYPDKGIMMFIFRDCDSPKRKSPIKIKCI